MEILFDFFLEIIFDGSLLLGESRRVPLAIRIIAAVVFAVLCVSLIGFLLFLSVCSFIWKAPLAAVICVPLTVAFTVMSIKKFVSFFGNR